jgi:hypothetical protein
MAIYSSANGPWGYEDSATYIITARNLMRGIGLGYYSPDGLFHVWTIKPPLYSVVLSLFGRVGADLVAASRWLNILLFAVTIFLGGLILIQFSLAMELSFPTGLLLLGFRTMVRLSGSAMSEPLFIFLLLAGIYGLLGLFKYRSGRWLILSAVSTSLLPMTRYIGIAMIPVGVLGILIFFPGSWKERSWKAVLFGVLASLPILVWEGWIYFRVDHSLGGRTVQFDWPTVSARLVQFYAPVTSYVMNWIPFGGNVLGLRFRLRYGLIFLVIAAVVLVTLLAVRRTCKSLDRIRADRDLQLFGIAGLWLVAYLLSLAMVTLVGNPALPIDNRIMLPFYAGLVLCLMGAVACWKNAWFGSGRWWLNILPWSVALGVFFWYMPATINQVMIPDHQGIGQTAYSWKSSETMAALRQLPKSAVIISNDSYAIWVWADRNAYDVIDDSSPTFILKRTSPYGSDLSDPAQVAFREKGAALVIFDREFPGQLKDRFGQDDPSRVDTLLKGLTIAGTYADGAIYYYPK